MSNKGRPILMGQAEVIDLVLPEIRKMLETDGFYVATDSKMPEAQVPLAVVNGKVFCMTVDKELDPERFLDTVAVAGPFFGPTHEEGGVS